MQNEFSIWAEKTIECSHQVSKKIAKNENIHGHSYWIKIIVKSSLIEPTPVESLQNALATVCRIIDHKHLNDFVPEGTMEAMAYFIYENFDARYTYKIYKIIIERKSLGVGVEFIPS